MSKHGRITTCLVCGIRLPEMTAQEYRDKGMSTSTHDPGQELWVNHYLNVLVVRLLDYSMHERKSNISASGVSSHDSEINLWSMF